MFEWKDYRFGIRVKRILDQMVLPPDWTCEMRSLPYGAGGVQLDFTAQRPDSRWVGIGERPTIPIYTSIAVPDMGDFSYTEDGERRIIWHIQEALRHAAAHEVDEWLSYKGKLIHDPHAPEWEWLV